MTSPSADPQFAPDKIAARLEIQHRVVQFVRGVDRLDLELARQAFHEDATDNHGAYSGPVSGLLDWIAERHPDIAVSHHQVGNHYIEFVDDDNAFSETYVLTWQSVNPKVSLLAEPSDDSYEHFGAARYIDHFTRRNGVWRIQKRVTVAAAKQRFELGEGMEYPPSWLRTTRDSGDPAQMLRAELGLGERPLADASSLPNS